MHGLASYFGWINYGFRKKYLATFNFRTDADSRFGKNNRWGYFPSGSVAWRVTEEDFMRRYHFVKDLKLRTSYGVTGNSEHWLFSGRQHLCAGTYADIPVVNLVESRKFSVEMGTAFAIRCGYRCGIV